MGFNVLVGGAGFYIEQFDRGLHAIGTVFEFIFQVFQIVGCGVHNLRHAGDLAMKLGDHRGDICTKGLASIFNRMALVLHAFQ